MTRSRSKGRDGRQLRAKERRTFAAEAALQPPASSLQPDSPGVTVEVFPDNLKCAPDLQPPASSPQPPASSQNQEAACSVQPRDGRPRDLAGVGRRASGVG